MPTQKEILTIINSEKWQTNRKELLANAQGKCQFCGTTDHVEVFVDKVEALENPNNEDFSKIVVCMKCFLASYIKTLAHLQGMIIELTSSIGNLVDGIQKENLESLPDYCYDKK